MKKSCYAAWCAVLVALALPAAPLFAEGGIGGRPASPNPEVPRSQSIFVHTLKPGDSVTDQLYVNNGSDRERTIALYAVDGEVANTGAYSCKQRAEPIKESGAWIDLSQSEVTLAPGAHQVVDFTIRAPSPADVGEHNACLVLQDKNDAGVQGAGVRVYTRQAVRVMTVVPGDLHRDVSIDQFTADISAAKQSITLSARNSGNVSTDTEVTVHLRDMFGREVYKNGGTSPVLAGTSLTQRYDSENQLFWGGWYTASGSVRYDSRADKYGLEKDAQIVERQSPELRVFVKPSQNALLIYAAAVLALVGIIIWIIVMITRRKRRRAQTMRFGRKR